MAARFADYGAAQRILFFPHEAQAAGHVRPLRLRPP
jgi:hypothetical protein